MLRVNAVVTNAAIATAGMNVGMPPLPNLHSHEKAVLPQGYNSYSIDNLMGDFLSVACDATGQYVGTLTKSPEYFYWSEDYGENFVQHLSPAGSTANDISIASTAPNYIAIAGNTGVVASSDYGKSFYTATPYGLNNWKAVTVSANATFAYAIYPGKSSSQGQIYISDDYLTTFTALTSAPLTTYSAIATSATGEFLYAVSTVSSQVYVFSNFGATYSLITGEFDVVSAIASSSSGQYVAMTNAYYGYLYSSNNYGQTWTSTFISNNGGGQLKDVAVSASGEKVAVVASGPAVYVSSDYGKTLTMTGSSTQTWTSVASSADGNDLYAVASQSHLFKSTDSGSTWTPLYYSWFGVASSQSGQIRFASTEDARDAAFYMTSDNGATWQPLSFGNQYYNYFSLGCNSDGQYVTIGTRTSSILMSSNYGTSWTSKLISKVSLVVTAVAASASGQYITAVTNPTGNIYISNDYGSTFTPVSSPIANFWCTAMSSSGQLQLAGATYYAFYGTGKTTGGYVYISHDFGNIWYTVTALPYAQYWSAVTSDKDGVNLAASQGYGGSIYFSRDSGSTWTNSHFTKTNFVAMCQSSSGQVLYVADGGGVGSLFSEGYVYASFDYGKTWNSTNSPSRQWAKIACDKTGEFVTATVYQGQLYTSSDFGDSWIPQNITVAPVVYSYDDDSNDYKSLSAGSIAGIVIGSVVGLGLIVGLVAVFGFGVTLPCFPSGSATPAKMPLLN